MMTVKNDSAMIKNLSFMGRRMEIVARLRKLLSEKYVSSCSVWAFLVPLDKESLRFISTIALAGHLNVGFEDESFDDLSTYSKKDFIEYIVSTYKTLGADLEGGVSRLACECAA